jgi:membrane-associated protease RseP (regulator of RpoE activity)
VKVLYSTFAAGPWSNVLTCGVFFLILTLILSPALSAMTNPVGAELVTVQEDYPALAAGLEPGMVVTSIDNNPTTTSQELSDALDPVKPGDTVLVGTDKGMFSVVATHHPENPDVGYMGVTLKTKTVPTVDAQWFSVLLAAVRWIGELFYWLVLLSLGLGLGNLLPLGPVDGGRMLQAAARQIAGDTKRGDWWWKRISLVTLVLILAMLIVPLARSIIA